MELEELKRGWLELEQRVNQKLAAGDSLAARSWKQQQLDRVRRGLWPLFWGQIVLMGFGIGLILLGAFYWSANLGVPHRMVCGLLIHVQGILTVVLGGITLGRMSRIDYAGPVLKIQQQLASLRRWAIGCGAAAGLPWWLLWLPLMQVIFGLVGGDFLGHAPMLFLVLNVAVGIVGLLATWLFHRWVHQPGREALAQRLDDSAAGTSLTRARRMLEDLGDGDAQDRPAGR